MTDQLDHIEHGDETSEVVEPAVASTSRRNFVSKGAIAAAVGAAAGIAMSQRASAANGSDLNLGDLDSPDTIANNVASNTTGISGGSTFYVRSGNSAGDASIYGYSDASTRATMYGVRGEFVHGTTSSPDSAGVYGVTGAVNAAGVYGHHDSATQTGPGVRGYSELGNGVQGVSADGSGVYGEATATNVGGIGVYGEALSSSSGVGVYGKTTGTQSRGVYGVADGTNSSGTEGVASARGSVGIRGAFNANLGSDTGDGVYGTSDAGDGVVGGGSRYDLYAAGTGIANLTAASPAIGATSTGAAGSIARNADGTLWYCYEANKWRKIAGGETGGAFHPVTPFRVYDSRKEADGKFTGGSNRTISVADSKDVDTYAVVTADAVPAGATAVVGNVVAIGTSDTGFLSINPGGTTAITAATVNWAAGMNIGNAGTFTLNSSRELEAVFGPGNGAHMTIDITGYYL
ncbi:hypothetical protein [Ilumatobacter coccineus]|uniref:Uncharacterized protein n=1 Tax=Ilumatobacter coccineus (strain NBRC 103263 / KCTC 29153 / YM16-304) TaxID=1313172 RepID=A0A6C7E659_ILUCY|nr:hypothetical protein [Ilumatobacter coccineus]BAN00695.1 hypothetical protein YM304_03810 [Ilumatobacter coccineus YM16-304]